MASRQELTPGLAILHGFERHELQAMAEANRRAFERACDRRAEYLPDIAQLNRWFKV